MFARALLVLALLTAGVVMAVVLRVEPAPPPPEPTDRGPAPFEGRAALDHQGQPQVALPGDEHVDVTK